MSVIEKLNSFISGRKLDKAVEGKSDKEKFAAVTGLTHVSDEILEDEKSAWFIPGAAFSKSNVNETQTEPEGPAESEPTDPETPETPETPTEPETPGTPTEPAEPETSETPETPDNDNTGSEVDIETQG